MQTDYHIDEEEVTTRKDMTAERLAFIEALLKPSQARRLNTQLLGRNLLTRIIDIALAFLRGYAPPIH
jgi:hypothetical protein